MSYISKYIYDYNHKEIAKNHTFAVIISDFKKPIKHRTFNHRIVNIIVFSRTYLNN